MVPIGTMKTALIRLFINYLLSIFDALSSKIIFRLLNYCLWFQSFFFLDHGRWDSWEVLIWCYSLKHDYIIDVSIFVLRALFSFCQRCAVRTRTLSKSDLKVGQSVRSFRWSKEKQASTGNDIGTVCERNVNRDDHVYT